MSYAFEYDEDDVGLCSLDDYPFAMHRHWFFGCRRVSYLNFRLNCLAYHHAPNFQC